jgi:uncharacterized protein YndB with AHSA1/START domain
MRVDEIRRELVLDAAIGEVWSALTTRERLSSWFGDVAEIDLRPGGRAKFGWTEFDSISDAIVEVVEEPTKFSFRWAAVKDAPVEEVATLVEFTLEPIGGGTRLTMVESGFAALPDEIYDRTFEGNTSGWNAELEDLVDHLAGVSSVG